MISIFCSITWATCFRGENCFRQQLVYLCINDLVTHLCRWNSALSIAIYSPGNDFYSALNRILWLRNCIGESAAIRRLVSFSLFFENKFPPIEYDANFSSYESTYQCIEPIDVEVSFKLLNHLTYPINVARNLARDAASTHFVLSSDVELYPSENFVGEFFKMIRSNPEEFLETRRWDFLQ